MRSDYEQRCDPPPRCGCGCRVLHGTFLFHTTKGASSCPHESMPTQTRTRSKLVMVPEYVGPALTAGGDVPLGGLRCSRSRCETKSVILKRIGRGVLGTCPRTWCSAWMHRPLKVVFKSQPMALHLRDLVFPEFGSGSVDVLVQVRRGPTQSTYKAPRLTLQEWHITILWDIIH
jgi:hypothetical protein